MEIKKSGNKRKSFRKKIFVAGAYNKRQISEEEEHYNTI